MGINKFIYYDQERKNFKNLFLIISTIFYGFFFSIKFYIHYLNNTITKLKFKGIKIGDLIVDHHLRFDDYFFEKKTFNFNTVKILYSVIFKILLLNKIYIKNKSHNSHVF